MVVPAWTQDYRVEKLAGMSEKQRTDAGLMGYGWRIEQLFRATGEARKVGHRFSGSVWRLLLAVATGEIADLGVIVDGPANKLTTRETDHGNLDEHAKSKCDRVAV